MIDERQRYERVHAILSEARRLHGESLAAYLDEACADDVELREDVRELLVAGTDVHRDDLFADDHVDGLRHAFDELLDDPDDSDGSWLPERIGSYTIVRRIGQGGMGVVYEAEQQAPRRRVAIKLLHPLHATSERLRRFKREAELLGRLQHPGIARILEAGTYDVGRGPQPYFALELVDGVDIRTHCERKGLDVLARVELLATVADAIEYAHEHGVVHRDLKPDNVLVDATGRPRVLDFGVARTNSPSATLSTIMTDEGQIVGTLAYIAPEQLERTAEVTAQVDVYALGVLAFEVLTGRLPYEIGNLSVAQAVALLTRSDPPRASSIVHALRGDLDTILAKALDGDRRRRYATAAALAGDLRRHLAHRPIEARPPSRIYLARKFTRRHRGLVAGTLTTLLTLAGGILVALHLADVAAEQRDEADAAALRARRGERRAVNGVLQSALAMHEAGRTRDAVELLLGVADESRDPSWHLLRRALPQYLEAGSGQWMFLDEDHLLGSRGREQPVVVYSLLEDRVQSESFGDLRLQIVRRPAACGLLPGRNASEHLLLDLHTGVVAERAPIAASPPTPLLDSLPQVSDDGRVQLWPTGAHDAELRVDGVPVRAVADLADDDTLGLADDGDLLAIGRHHELTVIDVATGDERLRYAVAPDETASARPVRGGVLLTTRTSGTDGRDGMRTRRIALSAGDATIVVPSPLAGGVEYTPDTFYELDHPRDGSFVAISYQGQALLRDPDTGAAFIHPALTGEGAGPDGRIRYVDHAASSVHVSPSGRRLVVSSNYARPKVVEFDPRASDPLFDPRCVVLSGHSGPPPNSYARDGWIYHLALSNDGSLVASAAPLDPYVRVWDARSGETIARLERTCSDPGSWGALLAFAPGDERLLMTTPYDDSSPALVAWDLTRGDAQVLARLEGHPNSHLVLLDPLLEALAPEPWARIGRQVQVLDARALVALYPANHSLDFAAPAAGRSWDVVPALDGMGVGLAIRPGGEQIAVVGDAPRPAGRVGPAASDRSVRAGELHVFAPDGSTLFERDLVYQPWCAAFSPDGSTLAVGTNEGDVLFFETEDYTQRLAFTAHASYVYSLAWTPDGTRLVTASGDATLRIWDTRPRHASIVEEHRWTALRAELATHDTADVRATYASASGDEREAARVELVRRAFAGR